MWDTYLPHINHYFTTTGELKMENGQWKIKPRLIYEKKRISVRFFLITLSYNLQKKAAPKDC